MEPVFMILGQSAATAAVLALNGNTAVQDVAYDALRGRLEKDGQILDFARPAAAAKAPAVKLEGIVVDDSTAEKTGDWASGTLNGTQRVGEGYIHDGNTGKGAKSLKWTIAIEKPGTYEIHFHYPPNANRATNVPVNLTGAGKTINARVNEQLKDADAVLGTIDFTKPDTLTITVETKGTDGHVVVDGVQLLAK
jgi:hypothetical protein